MVLNKNNNKDFREYLKCAVRTTFELVAAMVIAIALWSCRSIKNTTETESALVATEKVDLSKVSDIQANRQLVDSLWVSRMLTWNRDVKAVVYDTSKPVDSVTGKRPVLMEIAVKDEKTDSLLIKNIGKTDELTQMRDSVAAVVCDSIDKKATEKTMITKGCISFELMSSLILLGMIIGLGVWVGAVYWVRKR